MDYCRPLKQDFWWVTMWCPPFSPQILKTRIFLLVPPRSCTEHLCLHKDHCKNGNGAEKGNRVWPLSPKSLGALFCDASFSKTHPALCLGFISITKARLNRHWELLHSWQIGTWHYLGKMQLYKHSKLLQTVSVPSLYHTSPILPHSLLFLPFHVI